MSRSLRYAIVGAGMMGHEHIRNLELVEGAEMVAIADPHSESRWGSQQVSKQKLAEFNDVASEVLAIDPTVLAAGAHFGSTFVDHREFIRAVEQGLPASVTAEDGLKAVAMGVAAERSAVARDPVAIDSLL